MPRVRDEDREYAERLGVVLRMLREHVGWTRPQAAEQLEVSLETLGKWERGANAPKGYDLGRLYRGYEPYGADWRWFFDPPETVVVSPVRDRLEELRRAASAAARDDEEAERRRGGAGGTGARPDRRTA